MLRMAKFNAAFTIASYPLAVREGYRSEVPDVAILDKIERVIRS